MERYLQVGCGRYFSKEDSEVGWDQGQSPGKTREKRGPCAKTALLTNWLDVNQ